MREKEITWAELKKWAKRRERKEYSNDSLICFEYNNLWFRCYSSGIIYVDDYFYRPISEEQPQSLMLARYMKPNEMKKFIKLFTKKG